MNIYQYSLLVFILSLFLNFSFISHLIFNNLKKKKATLHHPKHPVSYLATAGLGWIPLLSCQDDAGSEPSAHRSQYAVMNLGPCQIWPAMAKFHPCILNHAGVSCVSLFLGFCFIKQL